MHSPLPSCTDRVGVAGDGYRYKSGVIKEESTSRRSERQAGVAEVTAMKQMHANTANSSVGGQPVELTECPCDVHSYSYVYGLQGKLQF